MKPEFVMLAHTYKPAKYLVAGWYISEKLDGRRAYWDGGISRGCLATEVPWANTVKDTKSTVSTGLWSRSGKIIYAPDWWLKDLPRIPLDGELWAGRGRFQFTMSTTSTHTPTDDWKEIKYKVFDSPVNLTDRVIKVRDYEYEIKGAEEWAVNYDVTYPKLNWNFEIIQTFLKGRVNGEYVEIVEQTRLPFDSKLAIACIHETLDRIFAKGAEGVMLRKPESIWTPIRSHYLLKYVPWKIDKGTVVGYQHAETGKIQGLMGALILDYKGKRLKISGFTDAERDYWYSNARVEAGFCPGLEATDDVSHHLFRRGTVVEFKYRELSDDGIPKVARYKR